MHTLKSTATTHNAIKNKQVRPPQQSDKFNNQKANQHIKGNTQNQQEKANPAHIQTLNYGNADPQVQKPISQNPHCSTDWKAKQF